MRLLGFLLASAVGSAQIRPDALLKVEVGDADHRSTYGADPLQFGELRLPKSKGPYAVVMMVHGGCWLDRLPGADPSVEYGKT